MTIAIVGLGGMGSAALYHLSRRGANVVGFEQFEPVHAHGSSHGESRIIRQAYFEDARYVPLLKRAYELWEELNGHAEAPLWNVCGGVAIGQPESPLIRGALHAARLHSVTHELLSCDDARRRFSAYALREDEVALYEPTVGALFPEQCVREHLAAAQRCRARSHFGTVVRSIDPRRDRIDVTIAGGRTIACDRVIVTAGAWLRNFLPFPVRIERNVQHWFEPANDAPQHIFMAQRPDWPFLLYGFPSFGSGVKAAFHHSHRFIGHASEHDSRASEQEIAEIRVALSTLLRSPPGAHLRSDPCMYTVTADEHFIIGELPGEPRILVAGGFSGHGFKFCSVVGEVLADLALLSKTDLDITLFSPERLRAAQSNEHPGIERV